MRRLASVFVPAARRTDKPDAPDDDAPPRPVHNRPGVLHSLSRKHPSPTDLPIVATDLANSSSSSSSSGSTTLRTPDDDGLPRTASKKGSWRSWLGGRNATAVDRPSQHVLHPPKPGSANADDVSSQSDDPHGLVDVLRTPSSLQQPATACANARAMIMNSLPYGSIPPPLLQPQDAISFPRSCHNPQRLRRRETLESGLHKKSLLARLDRLSPSGESSIAPLALKLITLKPQSHRIFEDDVFPLPDSVSLQSSGLENWVSRPCFEDRFQLWTCSDSGEIVRTRIPGSHLGVAALEFSVSLELLSGTLLPNDDDVEADVTFDPPLDFSLPPLVLNLDPPAQPKQPELKSPSSPPDLSQSTDIPAKLSPSRQPSRSPQVEPKALSPARQPSEPTGFGSATTNDPAPKRGVRFADDDGKDDQIPLGYVLRIRKNKEQKAQFLREERERRERATRLSVESRSTTVLPQENRIPRTVTHRPPPRPLISLHGPSKPQQPATVSHIVREEERLRREAERIEMEKLRRSREMARKQAEERERAYVEELQATRARREASRAGRPLELESLSPGITNLDRPGSRDSMQASFRRSSMSQKHAPELVFSPVSPHEGSPSSSVLTTPGSQYSFSRPPSLYSAHTASSEDVRGRDGKRVSRRTSVVSDSAKGMSLYPPYDARISFSPYMWSNVSPVPAIPPVPPMPTIPTVNGIPFYGVDMPLLPPTAPFMMNQFGARPSSFTGSGQHSPLQSSASLVRNYSSEGVNSSSRNSSPHSFESHQRRSSDEARMAKMHRDARTGSYNDIRGSKTSVSMHISSSQSSPHRSSWLPSEQSPTKKSSLRPVTISYSSGPPAHVRRRTAAS